MIVVEQHDVGARADGERADRPLQRLRARGQRAGVQPSSGRLPLRQRHDVAGAVRQPLPVFQLPQLGGSVDLDVRIGADAEAAAGREIGGAVEDAVAERRFGQRAETDHRAARPPTPRSPPSVVWVAWITHQRSSSAALSSSHSTGRRPSAATQSSTSRICSAAWIWIGPSGVAAADRPQRLRASPRAANAARCRRALAATSATDARARCDQIEEALGIVDEAALAGGRRRAAEAAIGVERRQQREADAGFARWPRRCAAAISPRSA